MTGQSGMYGDWKRWAEVLDGQGFEQRLTAEVARANTRLGLQGVRAIRTAMRTGDYEPNSALTIAIKGSSKPLVDTGGLFRAIAFDVQRSDRAVWVGVSRNEGDVSIAEKLHEGFIIDLEAHPEIRAAVFARLRERGNSFRPSNQSAAGATRWVVPPRPFIMGPLSGDAYQALVRQHYHDAFGRALRAAYDGGGA